MSATTAPTASTPEQPVFKPGLLSRTIAAFSGSVGLAVKIALLSVTNALAVWAAFVLVDNSKWIALAVLVVATAAIDVVYLLPRKWTLPAKFLAPGTVFLLAFQVAPIIYTVSVAFTNYSTGHIGSRSEAIAAIRINSLEPPPNGKQYTMAPARDADGNLVLILRDDSTGRFFVGTNDGLKPLPKADVKADEGGPITAAEGYKLVQGAELFSLDAQLRALTIPTGRGEAALRPQGVDLAVELQPTLVYDQQKQAFVRLGDDTVFADNGKGAFESAAGDELEPGWKTGAGLHNFGRILHDPTIRGPFLRVFVWTFTFAILTVFSTFAFGLFLAIALDKKGLRFQRTYRSILVIPWAIPGFLSLLVWQGLLNDEFGVVNRTFHLSIPWLFDGTWAKVSVLLVSFWLGFPYFFLVAMGALQSIPAELVEAARVDGGGAWQIFRRVTLPLLLVAVSPLLIASFAFNFNNFGNIYLLTRGGPAQENSSVAGSTDILITYTYKLALATGKGSDYGLACAVSVIIFFLVAAISGIAFWRTKAFEGVR